jgi:HlyD family secretion protein
MKPTFFTLLIALLFFQCQEAANPNDASGTFEAVETIIPANASGILKAFDLQEGQVLDSGYLVGYIDSTQLYLRKKQLQAQIQAMLSKQPNIASQLAAYQEQLKHAIHERDRITQLLKADAATQKQLDDAIAQIAVLEKQIESIQTSLSITRTGIQEETVPIFTQIDQVNDQLEKCNIINPVKGTVLTKYAEVYEMALPGKPLYKIADLNEITLRAYITGDQLPGIQLNQNVTVLVDNTGGGYKEYQGRIEWISDKAEFTPKTIQTKDERANLVYAIKINVKNDGYLKIGMYGEIKL